MQDNKIQTIQASEILDSRGNPTLKVTITAGDISAHATVPSGASTGQHEAHELRDGDPERYEGMGVQQAIKNVETTVQELLVGHDVTQLQQLDEMMIKADGTADKSNLGANAILGVSLAAARLGAKLHQMPLYQYLAQVYEFDLSELYIPTPLVNVFNAGKHASSNLDWQEFWIIPQGIQEYDAQVQAMSTIFHTLGRLLKADGLDTDLGDEGGYAPDIESADKVWEYLMRAIQQAGYQAGEDIFLGMDAGAAEFYNSQEKIYHLPKADISMLADELMQLYRQWVDKYPLIALEDGLADDDWDNWRKLTADEQLGKLRLIGDDLFTTNIERLQQGIDQQVANAILIKPNQIGTLSETVHTVKLAQKHNYQIAVSHRSGETEDSFIADLAVAVSAEYIKAGAPSRGERVAKYNRLLEIYEA